MTNKIRVIIRAAFVCAPWYSEDLNEDYNNYDVDDDDYKVDDDSEIEWVRLKA